MERRSADAFFGADRDRISWAHAAFLDRETEQAYQRHLVDHEIAKERTVTLLGVVTYLIFGVLDIITFKERLNEVLFVRFGLCGPIALLLVLISGAPMFRRWFQWSTAAVLAIGALSMVWMIAVLPPSGGPPYIVGILSIFIFFSCIQRIHFWLATAVFVGVAIAYAATVTVISPKAGLEVASGLFFIVFITMVALGTMYMQEVRSRLLWFRSRQRELDAAFIEELLIEATAADQSKLNFLSLLSHELRTPLHQIIGFSDVVRTRRDASSAEDTEYLNQINVSAHTLLDRIAKMLRYADATAGKIRYEIEDCGADELIDAIVGQKEGAAASRGVALAAGDVERAALRIDFANTVYALGHLVENAVNASPSGAAVGLSGRREGDAYLISVEDKGCGMSAEKIAAAFEPFSQAEALRTRTIEGVGLGLTLARKIFQDQNADLSIQSAPGRGTTATVRLPLAGASAQAA